MFQKILVATDGSGPATRAVNLGARLAKASGAKLIAISVYSPAGVPSPLAPQRGSGIDGAKGLLADVRKHHGDELELETEAIPGDPSEAIVETAKRHGADLIVIGDRGMSGTKHVLGSVPNTITHSAPCHVLLAHTADAGVDEVPLTKVLLTTDGSATAIKAVGVGSALAEVVGAKTLLLTVADPKEGGQHIEETQKSLGHTFDHLVVQGSVSESIIDTAAENQVDLIVTGSRGMQGARRLLGSVPNSVSHHLPCSMLIVKTT